LHTIADIRDGLLKNATRLQISDDLTEFPQEIFELADSLEILDLSDNQLSELPSNFAQLSQLKVLFLSNNQFTKLPAVLADCSKLEIISLKKNQLNEIPEQSIPLSVRCLVLTSNAITKLPDSIGELKSLQKLMLAGNQITNLPETLRHCRALQLMRVSANQLQTLPDFLFQLPKLAWLAFAGNPCCEAFASADSPDGAEISERTVAVKIYKGNMTSDGYSKDELDACIAAGSHASLPRVIGKVIGTDESGLIMHLIPEDYTTLGEPPTCCRSQNCTKCDRCHAAFVRAGHQPW